MKYLAFTESVASWLIGKSGLVDTIFDTFVDTLNWDGFEKGNEFVEGPYHIARSSAQKDSSDIIGFWNADYLSGTGQESWGFIRVSDDLGISAHPQIAREVMERCLYVVSQRLNGLMIDGAYFPRPCATNSHTCLAARGTEARQFSIAYYESVVNASTNKQQALVCVGPEQNWRSLELGVANAGRGLSLLVDMANSLLDPSRKVEISGAGTLSNIRNFLIPFTRSKNKRVIGDVEVKTVREDIDDISRYNALSLSYDAWMRADSSLTEVQRRILGSDAIDQHPIRIVGPGGSGKTLLMQLLAVRRSRAAEERGEPLKIAYIVHNQAMERSVRQRFEVLMQDRVLSVSSAVAIEVKTLSQIARELLELEDTHVINTDAQEAKAFQYEQVRSALRSCLDGKRDEISTSQLFSSGISNDQVLNVLAILIMSDISIAIKGQGLSKDRRKYVQSSRHLSRFHGALTERERNFVFDVFEKYHREVFENLEVLDSDDLAISLLGRIRTPIWELRRRQLGYDYIFVDETQLFNENERRILPFLSNGTRKHIPVVLALDEAQSIYGLNSAGFAALGIEGLTSESLASIHRSTKSIVELAFFVIQRSTDLFGADFPDFTNIADKVEPDNHPLARRPEFERSADASQEFGKFVLKRVRQLRKSNVRQIAVVVHSDQYWDMVLKELKKVDLPLHVMLTRGENLHATQPIVVVTKPAFVGGQEFDAVVLVGLEQGVVPPKMDGGEALSSTVEQQSLREIYLSVTRARYRVVVALSYGSSPSPILEDAYRHGLISWCNAGGGERTEA